MKYNWKEYYSQWDIYNAIEEENRKLKEMYGVYVIGTLKLKEENKKLKNKIKNWKIIRWIISDCIMLAFFCFMCSWMLCMLFQMIVDVIMWFQFVRFI